MFEHFGVDLESEFEGSHYFGSILGAPMFGHLFKRGVLRS